MFLQPTRAFLLVTARIALLAMLLAVLAPTISRMALSGEGDGLVWTELCTGNGVEYVLLDDASGEHGHSHTLDHCPYCTLAGHTPVLASAGVTPFSVRLPAEAVPPAFLFAPRPLFAWSAQRSRAPPQHS